MTATTKQAMPRKKKKGGFARLWLLLHGWLALPIWAFVFLVCVTGTLATVSHEIIWAINSDVRALRPEGVTGERISAGQLVAAVQDQRPGAQVTGLSWPAESHFAPTVSVTDPMGIESTYYVNPYDGHIQGVAGTIGFRYFIRALHGWLFLPFTGGYSWGWYAVTFMGIPMIGSLITGIMVYKKFWRAYFKPRLRIGKGARTFWGDLHRLAGIWSLPFVAIIGVTGTWFFVDAILSDNGVTVSTGGIPVVLAPEDVPKAEARSALPPVSLDALVASVHKVHPGMRIDSIYMPSNVYSPVGIYGRGTIPLFYESAQLNPYDAQVVKLRRVSDQSAVELVTNSMYPLHFGDFLGIWLKLFYFVFGLLLSMMVLSGMLIWTRRTARDTREFVAERRAAARLEPAE